MQVVRSDTSWCNCEEKCSTLQNYYSAAKHRCSWKKYLHNALLFWGAKFCIIWVKHAPASEMANIILLTFVARTIIPQREGRFFFFFLKYAFDFWQRCPGM